MSAFLLQWNLFGDSILTASPRIFIANRPSNVAATLVSRSVQARIVEPFRYLADHLPLQMQIGMPQEAADLDSLEWIFFNKAIDQTSLEIARAARAKGVRISYDIDDHILNYPGYSGAKLDGNSRSVIHQFLELSDVVTVANEALLQRYASKCRNITLLPNGIYFESYETEASGPGCSNDHSDRRPTVGFTNADLLKMENFRSGWLEATRILRTRFPAVRFAYFGDFSPSTLGLEGWEWLGSINLQKYRCTLFSRIFDIALVPLGGHEDPESFDFNSCKNPFKYIEFGAAGVPGIYSRVPIYEDVVKDQETGYLVPNESEAWIAATERLLKDGAFRQKIARNAQLDVMNRFHIKRAAAVLRKIVLP